MKDDEGGPSVRVPLAAFWRSGTDCPPVTAETLEEAYRLMLKQEPRPRTRVVSPPWWRRANGYGPHTAECEEMWGWLSEWYDTWPEDCCGYAAKWAAR